MRAGLARKHVGLAAVIVLLLATDVAMLYLRQGPAPLTQDVALDRFRSESAAAPGEATASTIPSEAVPAPTAASPSASPTGTTPAPSPGGAPAPGPGSSAPPQPQAPPPPPEGVYRYRTTGYERAAAFGGSRHDYPATTYITIRDKGCGVVMRWQPLEERWDESDHCPQGPNITIDRFAMYHEFFQRGQVQDYACDPGSHVYRAGQPAGATWKVRCSSPEFGAIDMSTRVVGVEPVEVEVEGAMRQAVRMRYDAKITGYSEGTQVQERWIDQATGLMLRITTQVDVQTQTPLGPTAYEERYRIELESLRPRT